jgi:hypothetical protein
MHNKNINPFHMGEVAMKRLTILSVAALMLGAIFPVSAGAGDDGTTLTAKQLDLRAHRESAPPGGEFWVLFQMMPPSFVDSLEIRYTKTGTFTKFRSTVMKGPQPFLSPSTIPVIHTGPTVALFVVDIPFGDTSGILLSVYYKGTPVDSMGMSFYREGDSVVFSRQTFPPPEPPRDPRIDGGHPLSFRLEPVSPLHLPGNAELRFVITPKWYYDSLYIDVNPIGNLKYFGDPRYTVPTAIGETSEFILPISIPPDDTSALRVEIYDNRHNINGTRLYFVTTDDTIEVYKSKPIGPRVTPPRSHESPRPYNPLFTQLAPATLPVTVGDFNLQFTVRPGKEYDSILFKVISLGNIQYHGDSVIYVPTDTGRMNNYLLPVTIPPNDTTGISLTVIYGDIVQSGNAIFFISTRDSVRVEYTNPAPGKLKIEHPMRIIPLPAEQNRNNPSIQILEPPAHPKKPKTDDSILGIPRKTPDGRTPLGEIVPIPPVPLRSTQNPPRE